MKSSRPNALLQSCRQHRNGRYFFTLQSTKEHYCYIFWHCLKR